MLTIRLDVTDGPETLPEIHELIDKIAKEGGWKITVREVIGQFRVRPAGQEDHD